MFLFALFCILVQIINARSTVLWRPDVPPSYALNNCEVCSSKRCQTEADYYKANMDTTVDPCEDFYAFACGNFVKKHANLPPSVMALDPIAMLTDETRKEIVKLLDKSIKPHDLAAFKKVKIQYQNCMNEARLNKDGVGPILKLLNDIGGWPIAMGRDWKENKFDLMVSLKKLKQKKLSATFPFGLSVAPNLGDTSRSTLRLDPPKLSLNPGFSIPGSPLPQEYMNYIKNVAASLGAKQLSSDQEARDMLSFEEKLFTFVNTQLNQPGGGDITVKDLSNAIKTIPWLELFNMTLKSSGIQINENEVISVPNLQFLASITDLIWKTPKRVVANFLGWSIIQAVMPFAPENLRRHSMKFTSAMMGVQINHTRPDVCAEHSKLQFTVDLSSMYVRKYFDEQIKRNVKDMFLYIKDEMRKNLQRIDWMDKETRREALDKLKAMRSKIGYPEELLDDRMVDEFYRELHVNPDNYLTSSLSVMEFLKNKELQNLRANSQSTWKSMPSSVDVNAYYNPQSNLVDVKAGFLGGSMYQYDRPQYLNFGALGLVIGHEITHAFDNNGRMFDKSGSVRDWWHPETQEKYLKKTECMVDQYSKYYVKKADMNVNGNLTLGENIADNGGIKLAYNAYNAWEARNQTTKTCLPNFENYTTQQMFWISAAGNSCSAYQRVTLKHLMLTDTHPPGEARVINTFSNTPEFARDFKCRPGSRMNPVKKCSVW